MKKFIDPRKIEDNFPIIVLVSHNNKLISWLIRIFSKGNYNHVCWLHRQGVVASQDGSYKERPLADYMKQGYKMKFYQLIDITCVQRSLLLATINHKLKKGKDKTKYDFLGLLGQLTGLKFINNPWKNFCSESVNEDLKKVLDNTPYKPSPAVLNEYCGNNPEKFKYLGHWISS